MEKNTRNAPIFADIFQFISKTKGLGENLTTPRYAADIFPSEASTAVVSHVSFSIQRRNSLAKRAPSTVVVLLNLQFCFKIEFLKNRG